MPVTRHPPHRPVLALLTHTVPTSDAWAPSRSVDQGCSVLPFFAACRTRFSPLGSLPRLDVRHELGSRVLLGQRPSLHSLLRPSPAFVRLLRRYYAAVRLPATVHLGLIAHRLRPAVRVRLPTDGNGVSRFSRVEFLCMHGVSDSAGRGALALSHAVMLSSGYGDTVDSLIRRFRSSQLRDTQPTYAPSQRFRNALAGRPAWFGVKMVATPFLYGSFIHYSTPVYPDANHRQSVTQLQRPRHSLMRQAHLFVPQCRQRQRFRPDLYLADVQGIGGLQRMPSLHTASTAGTHPHLYVKPPHQGHSNYVFLILGLSVPPNHLALAMRAAGRQRHSDLLIHPQRRRSRGLLTVSVPRFTPRCFGIRFRIIAGERSCAAFLFARCLFQQFLHSCDLLPETLVLTQRPVQTSLQGCYFPLQLFDATDRITRTHPA